MLLKSQCVDVNRYPLAVNDGPILIVQIENVERWRNIIKTHTYSMVALIFKVNKDIIIIIQVICFQTSILDLYTCTFVKHVRTISFLEILYAMKTIMMILRKLSYNFLLVVVVVFMCLFFLSLLIWNTVSIAT